MIRAIRGAITVKNDTIEEIKKATVEMLTKIVRDNNLNIEDIAYAEFSVTEDITKSTPARFARTELGWNTVPLMVYREFEFENGLKNCIRVLVVINTEKKQTEIKHVYLRDSQSLRPDLKSL
jgi:chorismate mutase